MAKRPRPKSSTGYKSVGRTYDGVKVLAPKMASRKFTAAEVRRAVQKALDSLSDTDGKVPLASTDALRIKQRDDGRFEVRKPGAKRASAIVDTQKEAVARAKELAPGKAAIAKRIRKVPGAKRGTWRQT